LLESSPDSSEWQQESERYNINTIIVPLGRDKDLQSFPALQQFCTGESWRPVYLDETSAVFVRRIPATESLIQRLQIDCSHVPLPKVIPSGTGALAFNQWARAAATLYALGRFPEALTATTKALAIFPDSANVYLTRGDLFSQSGSLSEAEREYLTATTVAPDDVCWARLAQIYDEQGSLNKGIHAWERAADLALRPYDALRSLGYDYLDAHRPQDALEAFDRAKSSLMKSVVDVEPHNLDLADLAHGRALAFSSMGAMNEALASQEEAVKLAPEIPRYWLDLANIYDRAGRSGDAERARKRAKEPSSESAPGGLR
jgi:tetratricopeptide (TPR) repeat protein